MGGWKEVVWLSKEDDEEGKRKSPGNQVMMVITQSHCTETICLRHTGMQEEWSEDALSLSATLSLPSQNDDGKNTEGQRLEERKAAAEAAKQPLSQTLAGTAECDINSSAC